MAIKLVVYNRAVSAPSDLQQIVAYIKKRPGFAQLMAGIWMIRTNKTTSQVRDDIKALIGARGEVMVIDITGNGWSSLSVPKSVTGWMKDNL